MMSNPNIAANINQSNVVNVSSGQNVSNAPNVSGVAVSGPNMSVSNVNVPNVSGRTCFQTNTLDSLNQSYASNVGICNEKICTTDRQ